MEVKTQFEIEAAKAMHELNKEIEIIKAEAILGSRQQDQQLKEKLDLMKEDRKDKRLKDQTTEQSKLIAQRKGDRGEITGGQEVMDVQSQILKQDGIQGQQ